MFRSDEHTRAQLNAAKVKRYCTASELTCEVSKLEGNTQHRFLFNNGSLAMREREYRGEDVITLTSTLRVHPRPVAPRYVHTPPAQRPLTSQLKNSVGNQRHRVRQVLLCSVVTPSDRAWTAGYPHAKSSSVATSMFQSPTELILPNVHAYISTCSPGVAGEVLKIAQNEK